MLAPSYKCVPTIFGYKWNSCMFLQFLRYVSAHLRMRANYSISYILYCHFFNYLNYLLYLYSFITLVSFIHSNSLASLSHSSHCNLIGSSVIFIFMLVLNSFFFSLHFLNAYQLIIRVFFVTSRISLLVPVGLMCPWYVASTATSCLINFFI